MATIATAEVRIIADTRRFVPDLRRKLRAAFADLGNQLGNDIVERIDRRVGQRLNTVMNQAARTAGTSFTQAFNRALGQAGLSDALREQLGGAGARRGARRAGEQIADALGDGVEGGNRRITDAMLDAISAQAIIRAAGFAGQDTAQAFTDTFRQGIRDDISARINEGLREAADDARDAIPPLFRGTGERSGTAFARGFDDQIDAVNEALFNAFAANPDIDSDAYFAGQRGGIQYSDGLFESLTDRLGRGVRQAVEDATATGIPPVFRRMGNVSAAAFVEEFAEETDTRLTARLRRVFGRLRDTAASDAGRRFGTRFGDAFGNALRALPGAIGRMLNLLIARPLAGLAGVLGNMTSEMVSMAGQALVVIALLEALSGLLFALPAATALVGAGIAAIIVPLSGVGKAFSAASGDAEKFEEALEGLTPAAQSVAREFRAISPALTSLRLQAQAAFFGEIQGAITEIADNLMDELTAGLESAAGGFGRVVDQIGEFLSQAETARTVSAVFEALTGIFDALAESTEPFLEGMRILVDEFIPEVEDFQGPLSRLGDEFRDWAESVTESGAALEAFERGRDTLEKILRIARDIGGIFDALFDAAESVGVDALGSIADAIADIREEFESVEGQETLGRVADALSRIADVVTDVFGAIFDNLAELAPDIAELFEDIGPPVVDAINGITDGIQKLLDSGGEEFLRDMAEELAKVDWEELGETIGNVMKFLTPLLPVIRGIINGIVEIFQFATRGLLALIRFVDNIDTNVLQPISRAAEDFEEWWKDLWFETIPGAIWDGLAAASVALAVFFNETLPGWFEDGLDSLVETVVGWGEDIKEAIDQIWEDLGLSVTGFFADMGIDVTDGLDGILASFTTWGEDLDLDLDALWTSIKDKAVLALDALGLDISGSLSGIGTSFSDAGAGISEGWTSLWTNIKDTVRNSLTTARDTVAGLLRNISTTITNSISGIRTFWTNTWNTLSGSVANALKAVRDRTSGGLSSIQDAFNGFVGRVRGLWNGLMNFLRNIASTIQSIAGRIAGYVSSAVSAASALGNINLSPFADGGIVRGPTPALVGEAGPEVIIPLTRPQRAVELVQQSGLMGILAAAGAFSAPQPVASGPGGPSVEMHVHSGVADPEQVARRAVRIMERRMAGRGLERVSP